MTIVLAIVLGAFVWMPSQASAKGKKYACLKADLKLAQTPGVGDSDGDGVSDCRESRYLHTFTNDADSDDDGLNDSVDFAKSCNPLDPDSDGDGIEDGNDSSPVVEQEMKAILDALSCPTVDDLGAMTAAGSISALGTTAGVDLDTRFKHTTCADLSTRLLAGGIVVVEIEILEDALGALRATDVELKQPCRGHGDYRHHDHDDD
jgi:hypothetical protein